LLAELESPIDSSEVKSMHASALMLKLKDIDSKRKGHDDKGDQQDADKGMHPVERDFWSRAEIAEGSGDKGGSDKHSGDKGEGGDKGGDKDGDKDGDEGDDEADDKPFGDYFFTVNVTLPSGQNERFDVEQDTTIKTLKMMIMRRCKYPYYMQRLVFAGHDDMDNHFDLEFYGIKDESTVKLLLRLDGGAAKKARTVAPGNMDKEQKLRDLNGELLSKVMLLGTPLFRNNDTDNIILMMQRYEAELHNPQRKNVLKVIMRKMNTDTLQSISENICGSSNNNDRFKKLSGKFFEPACHLLNSRVAAFKKMEEILMGLMEYSLTKIYMPTNMIDWSTLNKDVLQTMTDVAAGVVHDDDDDDGNLADLMRGLAF
jgi:hypothetical protein